MSYEVRRWQRAGLQYILTAIVVISVVLGVIAGCDKDKDNMTGDNGNGNNHDDQQVVDLYYQWATLSQQHKYHEMLALTYPGSTFEGATNVCKDHWDYGSELYYIFNSVAVQYLDNNSTAYVAGNVTWYQGPERPTIYTGFASTCNKLGNEWKLDGWNTNHEPDWWR